MDNPLMATAIVSRCKNVWVMEVTPKHTSDLSNSEDVWEVVGHCSSHRHLVFIHPTMGSQGVSYKLQWLASLILGGFLLGRASRYRTNMCQNYFVTSTLHKKGKNLNRRK